MASSDYTVTAANLRAMADAIRSKTGQAGLIAPNQMAGAVSALPTFLSLTQEEYDNLGTYDSNTYYCIVGS